MDKKYVVISAPVATRSGYGARSRDFIRALIEAKPEWDIHILPQRWGSTPMDALVENVDSDLINRLILTGNLPKKPDVWFQITVPNEFQAVGYYNIGVTAGVETSIMPPECIEGINRMDQIIVSSEFTKTVIEQTNFDKKDKNSGKIVGNLKSSTKIDVLFEGINTDIYDNKSDSEPRVNDALSTVSEDFAFLFVGHWLKGDFREDRKNVGGLIWTFLETFKNKKNRPALILKTNSGGTSLVDRVAIEKKIKIIKESIDARTLPNIYLIHSDLTDSEMNALYNHNKVKAHVSFTRGEGFGRPLLEATISGKPIIVSQWSGPVDFLHPEYVTFVKGTFDKVHSSAVDNFILKDSEWFTIDYSEAGGYMRDVVKNYDKYLALSRKHRKFTKDNFTYTHMVGVISQLIPNEVGDNVPKNVPLQLPKLKKTETPKIQLPKLKKIK